MTKEGEEHFVARVAQKVIIEKEGKILLVRSPGVLGAKWELPGGRLNKDELPQEGVKREVFEELGVEIVLQGVVQITTFVHPKDGDHLVVVYSAQLKKPNQEFVLEQAEIGAVKWISAVQLQEQIIWPELLKAIEIFFKAQEKGLSAK